METWGLTPFIGCFVYAVILCRELSRLLNRKTPAACGVCIYSESTGCLCRTPLAVSCLCKNTDAAAQTGKILKHTR